MNHNERKGNNTQKATYVHTHTYALCTKAMRRKGSKFCGKRHSDDLSIP